MTFHSIAVRSFALTAVLFALAAGSIQAGGIVLGQLDDFEDGTVMGWEEGVISPNPPVNVPDGGPGGAGDAYLENSSSGTGGPGGKMVMFNLDQWGGGQDYAAAGVTVIAAAMKSLAPVAEGAATLFMRVAIEGGPSGVTQYASTTAVEVPPDGSWHTAIFNLQDMSLIAGLDSLDEVLTNVLELRILSASAGPSWVGDQVLATLGVDNIVATRVPVSGTLLGASLRMLQCKNFTTGQGFVVNNPSNPWDCEAAGLIVNPGDKVTVQLKTIIE